MKVRELLEKLEGQDPDATVFLWTGWEGDPVRGNGINHASDGQRKAVIICADYQRKGFKWINGQLREIA